MVLASAHTFLDTGRSFRLLVLERLLGAFGTADEASANRRKFPAEQIGAYVRMCNLCYPHLYIEKAVMVVAAPGVTKVVTKEVDECSHAWEEAWGKYQAAQDLIGL